jgi:hypothetical protein
MISLNQFKAVFGESIVASIAATLCATLLNVPVWAMFIGWIAFFTRGVSTRDCAINMTCVLIGLGIGITAGLAGRALEPALGVWSITLVVLMATMVVLSLQVLPVINNVLAFFLGLVCFFASHLPPSLDTFVELGTASALGVCAGLMASLIKKYYSGRKARSLDNQISLPE